MALLLGQPIDENGLTVTTTGADSGSLAESGYTRQTPLKRRVRRAFSADGPDKPAVSVSTEVHYSRYVVVRLLSLCGIGQSPRLQHQFLANRLGINMVPQTD